MDQRKRVAKDLGPTVVNQLFDDANIQPACCKNSVLVRGLFSLDSKYNATESTIPQDCFLVSFKTTNAYHGSLACHPASSPCISINLCSKSEILLILTGKNASECADAILNHRENTRFGTTAELHRFAKRYNCKVKDSERMVF